MIVSDWLDCDDFCVTPFFMKYVDDYRVDLDIQGAIRNADARNRPFDKDSFEYCDEEH